MFSSPMPLGIPIDFIPDVEFIAPHPKGFPCKPKAAFRIDSATAAKSSVADETHCNLGASSQPIGDRVFVYLADIFGFGFFLNHFWR